eukprot:jgi/Antlo1/308/670
MRRPLAEATNIRIQEMTKEKTRSDKEQVISFLQDVSNTTKDHSLKYDLLRCLEIISGQENQEMAELKEEFVRVYEEREVLFAEKCDLVLENAELREKIEQGSGAFQN